MSNWTAEAAALAARWIVEEGLEYGPAKQRAAKQLGPALRRTEWPDNDQVEEAVREYLAVFGGDTQPAELAALRAVAVRWMERLAEFRPHLVGAVWRGTATRHSNVHLNLYCDDSKSAEIQLLNQGLDYDVGSTRGPRGKTVDLLVLADRGAELGGGVTVCLTILDHDDLRGGLRPDAQGRSRQGDLPALLRLLRSESGPADLSSRPEFP